MKKVKKSPKSADAAIDRLDYRSIDRIIASNPRRRRRRRRRTVKSLKPLMRQSKTSLSSLLVMITALPSAVFGAHWPRNSTLASLVKNVSNASAPPAARSGSPWKMASIGFGIALAPAPMIIYRLRRLRRSSLVCARARRPVSSCVVRACVS